VEQGRGHLDQAEDWYRKAIAINEDSGNRPDLSKTYGQMGLLAEERGDTDDALRWTIRSLTQFEEIPHPITEKALEELARMTGQCGVEALRRSWTAATGAGLPTAVQELVEQRRESRRAQ
jgi:tetratricopeptide (TPR) repeat protein